MSMRISGLAALAILASLAWIGLARADQPVPVPPGVDAPTITLQGDGSAKGETELVHGFHFGHGHYGGHYGHFGGYGGYGGYYRPYYGGYGGYGYSSYYKPYYYGGYSSYYYKPYYYGGYGYSSPYYGGYSSYYSSPYYYGGYSYYSPYYSYGYGYCISATAADLAVPAVPLGQSQSVAPVNPAPQGKATTPGQPVPQDKIFQYDGDPVPVPQPKNGTPQKNTLPSPQLPVKGLLVSQPPQPQSSGYVFPAYGENTPAAPKTTTPPSAEFAFPAYGEQPSSSNFATGGKK
jgi:hypothetical protein